MSGPDITGLAGKLQTITGYFVVLELPQLLLAIQVTLPEVVPHVTLILELPCPEIICAEPGTIHVYVSPVIAVTE